MGEPIWRGKTVRPFRAGLRPVHGSAVESSLIYGTPPGTEVVMLLAEDYERLVAHLDGAEEAVGLIVPDDEELCDHGRAGLCAQCLDDEAMEAIQEAETDG